jgi:MinD-like ATPase involved in chromosome partitioning or flagellar assembly
VRRIMGFSYKGGAGRSTALANIATALAKHGKKVLVIDFDMQAPGLHILFKAGPTKGVHPDNLAQGAGPPPGIPDYLAGDATPEDALKKYVFSLADICYDPATREDLRQLEGSLHFFSGIASQPGQDLDAARAGDRFAEFIDYLEDQAAFDYVCIDSPSGINARSEKVFDVSQLILIFYRWSTQHVEGTQIIMGYLNEYINEDQLGGRTYEIVGNAVPRDEDLRRDTSEDDADLLITYKCNVEEKLMKLLTEQYEIEQRLYEGTAFGEHRRLQLERNLAHLEYVIAEDSMMKLKEYLVVLHSDDTMYERIARDLIEGRLLFPEEGVADL